MTSPDPVENAYAAIILPGDETSLADVLARSPGNVTIIDHRDAIRSELAGLRPAADRAELDEPGCWVYYPWRASVIHLPGPAGFRRLRSDRNRNKITATEQEQFRHLKIGVVGLSVGHAIAHTLALEGLCGELRLADFDEMEITNLNRIPATVLDHGINKAVVTARRIAELDPYLTVTVMTQGLTTACMAEFFAGLDLVIEECDSLDMKVRVRQEARRRRIPVLMETSDRGLFDVERFDTEPDRPLFHGLLGDIDPDSLTGLSSRDKAPHVMRILEADELSDRMAASMVEVDRTINSWPQLGGDVLLGAATVAAAVRRLGAGRDLPSGRVRIDLDAKLRTVADPEPQQPADAPSTAADLTQESPSDPLDAIVHAIRLAPSGGNAQPWSIRRSADRVQILLDRRRSSLMDVRFRGSYVAIGAAGFNARVAAAHHGRTARVTAFASGGSPDEVLEIAAGTGSDPVLAQLYPAMVRRLSNRSVGHRRTLDAHVLERLHQAAAAESARARIVSDDSTMAELGQILAESDRLRYLSAPLHREMMAELKWPGRDTLDTGIDVRTLALDDTDIVKLRVARRPEVMAYLARWDGGSALGDRTRDVVDRSSALAVVTVLGRDPAQYLQGGAAMERFWITAELDGLGVQPMSPTFLYAREAADLVALSTPYASALTELQQRFAAVLGLADDESPILVMRLSHDATPVPRSERLPLSAVALPASPA